jgi:two-component system response regulator DesR
LFIKGGGLSTLLLTNKIDHVLRETRVTMIRVAIAEDHAEMKVVLKLFLGLDPEMELVFMAADGAEALAFVEQLQPDILVMDVQMPVLDGLESTKQIVQKRLDTRVILISLRSDAFIVNRARDAGAMGFVPKEKLGTILLEAIRTVHDGKTFFVEST